MTNCGISLLRSLEPSLVAFSEKARNHRSLGAPKAIFVDRAQRRSSRQRR